MKYITNQYLKNYLFFLSDTKIYLLFETCKYICNYFQTFFNQYQKELPVISRHCYCLFDYTTKVRIIFISTNIFVLYFIGICVFNICL